MCSVRSKLEEIGLIDHCIRITELVHIWIKYCAGIIEVNYFGIPVRKCEETTKISWMEEMVIFRIEKSSGYSENYY